MSLPMSQLDPYVYLGTKSLQFYRPAVQADDCGQSVHWNGLPSLSEQSAFRMVKVTFPVPMLLDRLSDIEHGIASVQRVGHCFTITTHTLIRRGHRSPAALNTILPLLLKQNLLNVMKTVIVKPSFPPHLKQNLLNVMKTVIVTPPC